MTLLTVGAPRLMNMHCYTIFYFGNLQYQVTIHNNAKLKFCEISGHLLYERPNGSPLKP